MRPSASAVSERVLEGAGERLLYSQHVEDHGAKVHAKACSMGLEGIVSNLADSPYRSGRNETWMKATPQAGFRGAPARSLKAIYLGRREGKDLIYTGKAGTGFSGETARA